MWLDEIFQAETAHLGSAGQVVQFAQANIDQMPLAFAFTWLLGRWGDDAFILRLPSAIIGIGAVIALYALGSRLAGRRLGVIAAVLMTVMPYAVWYSQEARDYVLLMLLTTLQMYFAYGAMSRGRFIEYAGLAICTILNLYNHYLALLVTAGIAAFVGVALLSSVLRPATRRTRIVAGVLVLAAALAAVAIKWRPLLRSMYELANAEFARHPRSGLAAAAIIAALAAASLVWLDLRLRAAHWEPATLRQIELTFVTGATVLLAYMPWLPSLRVFLGAPNQGIGRLDTQRTANWVQLFGIAPRMGWSDLILILFFLGLVTLVIWSIRGRALQSLLLACWLAVPTGLLVSSTRWAIVDVDIRYLAWLFPGAVLVSAVGVEGVIGFCEFAMRRVRRRPTEVRGFGAAVAIVAVALMLIQALPALATSYNTPKDDWRDVAGFLSSQSTPGSLVLSVGNYSDWAVICLGYYFREHHSDLRLTDGAQLTSDDVSALNQGPGSVWGVVNHPSAAQLDLLRSSGDESIAFVDVTRTIYVVRGSPDQPMLEQTQRLLDWETPLEPALQAPAAMLAVETGTQSLGPSLMAAPEVAGSGWTFTGRSSANGDSLSLQPSGAEADGTFSTSALTEGDNMLLAFDHRGHVSGGQQLVFAVMLDRQGHQLEAVPSGAGYPCAPSDDWTQSYFAFRVPPNTAGVALIFRATGTGIAEFRSMQLSQIR